MFFLFIFAGLCDWRLQSQPQADPLPLSQVPLRRPRPLPDVLPQVQARRVTAGQAWLGHLDTGDILLMTFKWHQISSTKSPFRWHLMSSKYFYSTFLHFSTRFDFESFIFSPCVKPVVLETSGADLLMSSRKRFVFCHFIFF